MQKCGHLTSKNETQASRSLSKEPVCSNPVFIHLSLFDYKKVKCSERRCPEIGKCMKYHNDCDTIRNPQIVKYRSIKCPNPNCSHDRCQLSRNYLEKIYHPDFYKKKICFEYFSKGVCKYDEFCALAHSYLELKIPLLNFFEIDRDFLLFHFKTEFCPINLFEHDKFLCVYAHNYQDYRRKWSQDLIPQLCKSWDPNSRVEIYETGCPKGFDCRFCHGWKELDYHHTTLKKNPCKKKDSCGRKNLCSYYHSPEDRFDQIESEHFLVVPRNRRFDTPKPLCAVEIINPQKGSNNEKILKSDDSQRDQSMFLPD